jgi:hypothetical protein
VPLVSVGALPHPAVAASGLASAGDVVAARARLSVVAPVVRIMSAATATGTNKDLRLDIT